MANINRWLLPEGVEEILPAQARQIEFLRRQTLDLYISWGYELVIPPLIEYSESLLIGMGSDMDLQSFKLTDQLSGRTLAIRADITPQTARMDAHSYSKNGPTRICYAGTVVHTKPKSQLGSRTPIEIGAELYGDDSLASDIEVISLMLKSLQKVNVNSITLDLGHVAVYRELLQKADLSYDDQELLFDAFDRKAKIEISEISKRAKNLVAARMLSSLVDLHGDFNILYEAEDLFVNADKSILYALEYLFKISKQIRSRFKDIPLFIDLAELRGYQYHTGLVFAAYVNGIGHTVANGGRYDGIGNLFGRDRPATGFSINLKALLSVIKYLPELDRISAPGIDDIQLNCFIDALRYQGQCVIRSLTLDSAIRCNKELIKKNGKWYIVHKF